MIFEFTPDFALKTLMKVPEGLLYGFDTLLLEKI